MAWVVYRFVLGDNCDDQCLASSHGHLAFWTLLGQPGPVSMRCQLLGSEVLVGRCTSSIYVDSVAHCLSSSLEEE